MFCRLHYDVVDIYGFVMLLTFVTFSKKRLFLVHCKVCRQVTAFVMTLGNVVVQLATVTGILMA